MHGNVNIKTHAEIDALEKIKNMIRCKKIKKTTMNLFVIRINKEGKLCNSAPCYHCTNTLLKEKDIKINKLYYSTANECISCIKFNDWIQNDEIHISSGWKWLKKIKK